MNKLMYFNIIKNKNIYYSGEYMFKQKIHILCLLPVFISVFGYINIKAKELPLLGKVIYLDAGHGGTDPGSIYKDIYEKDINLQICMKLQEELGKQGAIVYMTRYDDYDLSDVNA